MIAISLGEMGWSFAQIRATPITWFIRAVVSHQEAQDRKSREMHEIIRMHATVILNSFSKSRINPTQVMGLAWDPQQDPDQILQEAETRRDIYQAWMKDRGFDISLRLGADGKVEAEA